MNVSPYPDVPPTGAVPCALCEATMQSLAELSDWQAWTLTANISQQPGGSDHMAAVEEPAGTFFILCPACSGKLSVGNFRPIADHHAEKRRAGENMPAAARDMWVKEMILWLVRVQRDSRVESLGRFLTNRIALSAVAGGES